MKMKLFTLVGLNLIIAGIIGATYGLYQNDGSSFGIIAISLATTWGMGFAFISKRKESKREIRFK